MRDALLVGVIERLDRLNENPPRFFGSEPALTFDVFVKVDAIDVFQSEIVQVVGLAVLVERDDVLVAELGGMACFAAETLQGVRLIGQRGIEHFQGDEPAKLLVGGLIDCTHAATGDVRQHFVFAEAVARIKSIRRHEYAQSRKANQTVPTEDLTFWRVGRVNDQLAKKSDPIIYFNLRNQLREDETTNEQVPICAGNPLIAS